MPDSDPLRCRRCGGPSHRLPDEAYPAGVQAWHAPQASHWCRACMAEEWPHSDLGKGYALVWKYAHANRQFVVSGLPRHFPTPDPLYRGVLHAPYKPGFPQALLGPGNFLLSPLGALKARGLSMPHGLMDTGCHVLAVVVPWSAVALDRNLVLCAGAYAPYLTVAAHPLRALAADGLSPHEATRLLDALPEATAWAQVDAWEARLRPALPADWQRSIRAAERWGRGLSPLGRLSDAPKPPAHSLRTPTAGQPQDQPDPQRAMAQRLADSACVGRFLGHLAEALFADEDLLRRYREEAAKDEQMIEVMHAMMRVPPQLDGAVLCWEEAGEIKRARFNVRTHLDALFQVLRADEAGAWRAAIEHAAALAG